MNSLLLQRLESIIQICFLIKDSIYDEEEERKKSFRIIPFNPDLWEHAKEFRNSSESEKQLRQKTQVKSALNFDQKEINKMPKQFRTEYTAGRVKAHVRFHNGSYEVRCQIYNRKITASAKTVGLAKFRFLDKLKKAFPLQPLSETKPEVIFGAYVDQWLETTKKPYVKENTYNFYLQAINAYVKPRFGAMKVTEIKQLEIQRFFNEFTAAGKNRTARTVYQLMTAVFEYAVADELLNRSPMAKIIIASYEEHHGTPLTRPEEQALIEELKHRPDDVYRQAFVFFVYTGLRRSELATVSVSGEWVTVSSAKQRKGRSEKIRRIPISPMLKKVMPLIDVDAIRAIATSTLSNRFKRFCRAHHLHDLRHTFITRCQECGIAREIVSLWAGHVADRSVTTTVYTHLEQFEQRQLEEIAKLNYDF